ncbi:M24 family metallopeptidase [Halarsenatibacter silvermanii]|uniref:Xaa-Pro aminopeptidase n=1 Tax=Halarsenatibacter silvermanii TaxID=321763 RepID=A0A1G9JZA8_9FIRM|nr:Xaa-Pro peptidase family protein [Halarsenatibacter silvermanii]SDL42566.1 Xaa-Pro aminopeptidase [Halarsenatibacter silvermanii]
MRERLEKSYKVMETRQLDAVLVTSFPNRFYFSGFSGTSGQLLLQREGKNFFITDFRYTEQASEETEGYEIVEVNQKKLEQLAEVIREEKITSLGFENRRLNHYHYKKIDDLTENTALIPLDKDLDEIRLVKSKEEIETIKEAIGITEEAFSEILNFIEPGLSEKRIAAELEYILRKKGGEGPAFDFIVASGQRSALPHGVASEKKLKKGEFVTLDFGIRYSGYCSDMTRTIFLGEPLEKHREIYDLVLSAHNEVIEKVKPGLSGSEADALARDLIEAEGYGDNFGHGLGHGLGIEVHEGPKLSSQSDTILKPGMIFTDEPGIYISGFGGVRIEDDILLNDEGAVVLNNFTKELITL